MDTAPQTSGATLDDHALAHSLADQAAVQLVALRAELQESGVGNNEIELEGDATSHRWICDRIAQARPDDALLSEEGDDDGARVSSSRTWIVDPLDGSSSFGIGSPEWAVHIALAIDGVAVVGAVASPGVGVVASTFAMPVPKLADRDETIIVSGRTRAHSDGAWVAQAIGAKVVACSSAGVKAALLATGRADVYVHDSPLYEWDVCAPAAMAEAGGLEVSDPYGNPLVFNKTRPVVDGLVICRPKFTDAVLAALDDRRG